MSSSGVLVVLATFPNRESARQIGTILVEKQLAACVNISPEIQSIYRWEGEIQSETEAMAVIKTTVDRFELLEATLRDLHPYEVPEIIALPVEAGSRGYLDWVRESTCGE